MEALAVERNLHLSYGFHFRHSDQVTVLKQMIDENEIGEIYHAEIKWNRRRGIPGWGNFTNKDMQGGGPLIDIGAHMLDSALYLMEYPEISLKTTPNLEDRKLTVSFHNNTPATMAELICIALKLKYTEENNVWMISEP